MTIISLIAALDKSNGIGLDNQLLCHLPADLQHFKNTTMNKPIIMGRHTYNSIGRPLPGRTNIVLSNTTTAIDGVTIFTSLAQALADQHVPEIMIIGGAQLFNEAISLAHRLYITRINHHFKADVFFPEIKPSLWLCNNEQYRPSDEKNQYDMSFLTYERKLS